MSATMRAVVRMLECQYAELSSWLDDELSHRMRSCEHELVMLVLMLWKLYIHCHYHNHHQQQKHQHCCHVCMRQRHCGCRNLTACERACDVDNEKAVVAYALLPLLPPLDSWLRLQMPRL